jgi:hypothetical protein
MPDVYHTPGKITQPSAACVVVTLDNVANGWEQWLLLSSDRHHDSERCDRELEKRHLEKAKERGALVIDAGDIFDACQGKFDPRRSYSNLRPEYKVDNYLDAVVSDAAKFYAPYAGNILLIGRGNHDQAILKNNGVDLVSNLVHDINTISGTQVVAGGYGGWVRFQLVIQKTRRASVNLKYFHGSGGGGPVTRGVISTNRQAVYTPDADIVLNGHTHDAWLMPISRERLSERGAVSQDLSWYVRTPTYANDYGDGTGGWHVETWKPPKPKGCAWVRMYFENNAVRIACEMEIE